MLHASEAAGHKEGAMRDVAAEAEEDGSEGMEMDGVQVPIQLPKPPACGLAQVPHSLPLPGTLAAPLTPCCCPRCPGLHIFRFLIKVLAFGMSPGGTPSL